MKHRLPILALAAMALSVQAADTAKPSKVCSVASSQGWRDSIREGDGATVENCKAFMQSIKADNFQVGCMTADGAITLGAPGGALPSPNCGW